MFELKIFLGWDRGATDKFADFLAFWAEANPKDASDMWNR